jgi:hypothetical protein
MANNLRNFVEGIGIADTLPTNPAYFTETSIYEVVCLPEQKPDIEQLISVMADIEVVSTKIIHTPVDITSPEGQHLSGCKLSFELLIRQKIKYVADEPTQSVHAAHFETTMASVFVVVPCQVVTAPGVTVPISDLLRQGRVVVTPYIEDIYGDQRGKRCIFKNITLLLDVTFR